MDLETIGILPTTNAQKSVESQPAKATPIPHNPHAPTPTDRGVNRPLPVWIRVFTNAKRKNQALSGVGPLFGNFFGGALLVQELKAEGCISKIHL